jgi:excisionase family DNA binding protein
VRSSRFSAAARLDRELAAAGTPHLLHPTEAARVARMTAEGLLDHVRAGRLRASRPGGIGRWRIARSDLAQFLSGATAKEPRP